MVAASPRPPRWANKIEYWPPKTCPRLFSDPRPAGMDFRLRGGIGPLRPAPAYSQMSLREG